MTTLERRFSILLSHSNRLWCRLSTARKFSPNFKRHIQQSSMSSRQVETTILCPKPLGIHHRTCQIFHRTRSNPPTSPTTVSSRNAKIRSSSNTSKTTTSQSLSTSITSSSKCSSSHSSPSQTTIWTIKLNTQEISTFRAPSSNLQVQNSNLQIKSHTEHR